MPMIELRASPDDRKLINQIADRALADLKHYPDSKLALLMDIEACHENGCPLDLDGLLAAKPDAPAHHLVGADVEELQPQAVVLPQAQPARRECLAV